MKNVAWTDKDLQTFLGSWTELRHDTLLYAKQSSTMLATSLRRQPKRVGAYVEPEHYFIQENTLGLRSGRHCLPWAQSKQPGYPLGGGLFDLERWNEAYFARLKDFVADGLVQLGAHEIRVTMLGRIFIRNVAMVFDSYLKQQAPEARPLFSKTL